MASSAPSKVSQAPDAATTSVAATTSASAPPPQAKRVRREYPWRSEYVRELAVRPIQRDERSGDVVLVECRLCARFGREEPPAPRAEALATASANGAAVKTRARTRNVAHWKYPFRTDNMRSHHQQQHPRKWGEYLALLERAKHAASGSTEEGSGASNGSASTDVAHDLLQQFFGAEDDDGDRVDEPGDNSRGQGATRCVATARHRQAKSHSNGVAAAVDSRKHAIHSPKKLVDAVSRAIVDTVVAHLPDLPDDDTEPAVGLPADPEWTELGELNSDRAAVRSFAMDGPHAATTQIVWPLLRAGASFSHVAGAATALPHADLAGASTGVVTARPLVTRHVVAAYARALVASNLQMLSDLLLRAWTYALRLYVQAPASADPYAPIVLHVRVRVPSSGQHHHQDGTSSTPDAVDVAEFHVVSVALHSQQQPDASDRVVEWLRTVLRALDPQWTLKLQGIALDGATHCLPVHHAALASRVLAPRDATAPFFRVHDGATTLDAALQHAWTAFVAVDQADASTSFTKTLVRTVARLRCDAAWVQRHGHCPAVRVRDAWSVSDALTWLVARREQLQQQRSECSEGEGIPTDNNARTPSWWWLAALVLVDVLASCRSALTRLQRDSDNRTSALGTRELVRELYVAIADKCCVAIASDKHEKHGNNKRDEAKTATRDVRVMHDASSRSARLGQWRWRFEDAADCFRSLSLSTRRHFGQVESDPHATASAIRVVCEIVLRVLDALQPLQASDASTSEASDSVIDDDAAVVTTSRPPTSPIMFALVERATSVVDLVEAHSARLERHFSAVHLDAISREMRDLRTRVSRDDALKVALARAEIGGGRRSDGDDDASVFAAAWDCVAPCPALRLLAAGLATVLPSAMPVPHVTPTRRECDEHVDALGDLALDARLHALQLERLAAAHRTINVSATI